MKNSLRKSHLSCKMPLVISLTGASDSGKTASISYMLPRLNKIGLKDIIVIKKVSGRIDLAPTDTAVDRINIGSPPPSSVNKIKDSDIFISSGARYVLLISNQVGGVEVLAIDGENRKCNLIKAKGYKYETLNSILSEYVPDIILEKSSFILVEGFSADDSIPHIYIDKPGDTKSLPPNILARFPAINKNHLDEWQKTIDAITSYFYIFYAIYSPRPVFVGVGNDLRGDDAFGPLVIERLSSVFKNFQSLRIEPLFINTQMTPENYIGRLVKHRPTAIVVFDAISDTGGNSVHGLRIFTSDEILGGAVKFSTHGGGLKMFIDYLKSEMSDGFPPFALIGISPQETIDVGGDISESLKLEVEKLEMCFKRYLEFFLKKLMS